MTEPLKITIDPVPADSDTLVIRVNRPVSPGRPLYIGCAEEAEQNALARALMETGHLEALLLQDQALTLLKPVPGEPWEKVTRGAERIIEEHFRSMDALQSDREREMLPEETERAVAIQEHLNEEINPLVASHGGFIEVLALKSDTVYVHMGGGCQGCGMATVTLKQGVETSIFRRFPEVKRVLDTTDHAAGLNPYYAPSAK